MKKYSFKNDYSEGAYPTILERLLATNLQQQIGYGEDEFCNEARELIKKEIKHNAAIHFVSGGTLTNLIVISSILKPYESVITTDTGHIAVHETGAIEATGHKINTIISADGKLIPEQIQSILDLHTDEHMVKPKLVYISNSTEIGSLYKKDELKNLYNYCQEKKLYLFIDGARLASALTSVKNDITLEDMTKYSDVFYIGGTKNGSLLGEAIIINNLQLNENFRYNIKQKGGMLAKGRLIGIQFAELFKNNLFFELGLHANKMAKKLAEGISEKGFQFLIEPCTNQIFPIFPIELIKTLQKDFDFFIWENIDEKYAAIRLVTSWATIEEKVDEFLKKI